MATRRGRGWIAFVLVMLCAIYGVGLVISVAAVPAFDGETLLEYGGAWSPAIVSQPLIMTMLMWTLLRRRCTTGSRTAIAAAWVLGALFFVYSVLGALSIAAGAFPASFVLLAAIALTPSASVASDGALRLSAAATGGQRCGCTRRMTRLRLLRHSAVIRGPIGRAGWPVLGT